MNYNLNIDLNKIGSLEEFYKLVFAGYLTRLSIINSEIFDFHRAINSLKKGIETEQDPVRKAKFPERLQIATANLELLQAQKNLLLRQIESINLGRFSIPGPVMTEEQKRVVNAIMAAKDDDLTSAIDARTIEIDAKFHELEDISQQIFNAKTQEKIDELIAKYRSEQKELNHMESNLSLSIRNAKAANQINDMDYEKYCHARLERGKRRKKLYGKTTQFIKSNQQEVQIQQATPAKQEAPVQQATPVKQEAPVQQATPVKQEAPVQQAAPIKQEPPVQQAASVVTAQEMAQRRANSLAASVNRAQDLQRKIEHVPSAIEKEMSLTSNKEDLDKLKAQLDEETEAKRGTYTQGLNSELKQETKKVGIKKNVNPDLLRQRDRLANELNQMRAMYGTVQNEEYQIRVEQLKELDKQIFGHKANRIYRDLNKPIALIGGSSIELPKAFLDMRIGNNLKSK